MRKLIVFNQVTLDGYFSGVNGDISWAHKHRDDAEWNAFVAENAGGGGILLFGRKTYELMVSYWPTPEALKNDPEIAKHMNARPKIVFSKTLGTASWTNTKVVQGDLVAEVRKIKNEPGPDMAILGSGSIVSQLASAHVIDEYQVVVNPMVLGAGKTMFEGVRESFALRLTRTRIFKNGNVLLCYGEV